MGAKSRSEISLVRLAAATMLLSGAFMATARAQEVMPVTVVLATEGAVTEQVPVVGTLMSREEVEVHPQVVGQPITRILAERGQYVEKGEPLAVLDTTDAQMLLDKNAVSILRAEAAVAVERSRVDMALVSEAEAGKTLDRSRALQPKGAVSEQLLDEHRNAHARAVAELGVARQSLSLAEAEAEIVARERREIELTIERSTLRAPSAGLVLSRTARLGAMASNAGNALFVIAEDGAVEFVTQVVETDFVRLHDGMRAEITLPGRVDPISGAVRLKAAQVDPATRNGEVRIELDESEGVTRGVFARGTISIAARNAILVPGTAVRTVRGTDSVYVVAGGIVDIRRVTVGTRRDGIVEITDGVSDGEMVVLKAGGFLKAQEKVEPVIAATDKAVEGEQSASLVPEGEAGRANR